MESGGRLARALQRLLMTLSQPQPPLRQRDRDFLGDVSLGMPNRLFAHFALG
jgi:hypothetical protein